MEKIYLWLGLLFGVPGMVLEGYTISKLWGWFVFPLVGIKVGIASGLGLSLLLSSMTIERYASAEKETNEKLFKRLVTYCCFRIMFLMMGWIIKEFFL